MASVGIVRAPEGLVSAAHTGQTLMGQRLAIKQILCPHSMLWPTLGHQRGRTGIFSEQFLDI